jgi:hypothetical protein
MRRVKRQIGGGVETQMAGALLGKNLQTARGDYCLSIKVTHFGTRFALNLHYFPCF